MHLALNRVTLNPAATPAAFIRAAYGAGFHFVELSAGKLRAAVEQDASLLRILGPRGVTPVHGGWNLRLHWPRERFEAALVRTPADMDFAVSLGSRGGTLVLPRIRPGGVALPGPAEVQDRVGRVADLAAARDLDVMVEFIGLHHDDPPECGLRTLAQTLDLVGSLHRANLGVLIDSFHWHASGAHRDDLARIPAGMPLFVHLNDAPHIAAALLEDSARLLPGQGVIDLPGLLGALRDRGYDGPVSIELKNPALHAMGLGEAARCALDAGRTVLRHLGHPVPVQSAPGEVLAGGGAA